MRLRFKLVTGSNELEMEWKDADFVPLRPPVDTLFGKVFLLHGLPVSPAGSAPVQKKSHKKK